MSRKVLTLDNGKVVGTIKDEVLKKTITDPKQILMLPTPAFCIQKEAFDRHRKEFHSVEVTDKTTVPHTVYRAKKELFTEIVRRGHGPQYRLPIALWGIVRRGEKVEQMALVGF